jgi:hypothetical protein
MGGLFPSAPKQPSMEEQYALQKKMQDQANSEAVTKSEEARRKASLDRQRSEARRRSGSSLITSRQGGLLANEQDTGVGLQTLYTPE